MKTGMIPSIIDVEASGFGCTSYPIEVGVVLGDGQRFCTLITPVSEWTSWDDTAEQLHGISRDMLQTHGNSVDHVATELNTHLYGMTLFSDGWVVDHTWLITLFHAAKLPMHFHVSPLEMILTEHQMSIWHTTKDHISRELALVRHRASHDAWMIQETYRRTRQMTGYGQSQQYTTASFQ